METTVPVPGKAVEAKGNPRLLNRVFTSEGQCPFDTLEWKTVDAVILGAGGKEKFRQDAVEVPASWSDTTVGIVAEKYFRVVNGVKEKSARQMFSRVAGWISTRASERGLITAEEADVLYDELLYMLVHGMYAFNSPVWFNVGASADLEAPQCSACFIQSVDDTMDDIMDLAKREVMLFKGGSGTGGNLSSLRSSWEKLSRGGYASGPVSFMLGYDAFAGVTKSGGTTRRAAKMQVLNIDHPDILHQRNGRPGFITCKSSAEKLAKDLYETGKYTAEWNVPGNVYDLVPYQNANNSVRVTDAFMNAVDEGLTWDTKLVDGTVHRTYEAAELFDEISKAAHVCGDPGLQFDTTTNKWHTCKESGRINASNPCSEYLFLDETACNLGSLNLMKFTDGSSFLVDEFKQAVRVSITAKELLVGMSSYPSKKITEMSHKYRTLGLGFTNLGALLTFWGLPYDGEKGRTATSMISSLMGGEAYAQSARLSRSMGPFSEYAKNRQSMLEVMNMHLDASRSIPAVFDSALNAIGSEATRSWAEAVALGKEYGYRNAQTTVIAPTGTISFLMGCDTTGIEPMLGCVVYKKVVGEGLLTMPNNIVEPSLHNLGYSDEQVKSILEHIQDHGTIHTAPELKEEHHAVFAEALGDNALRPEAHVDMMAAVQPFISGGISKTVNMPESATPQDIAEIYMRAWRKGLKCIAVFRNSCKLSQPINTELTDKSKFVSGLRWGDRRKIPDTRKSTTHKFSIAGLKGYITAGDYEDGTPAEVFLRVSKQGSFVNGVLEALATAVSVGLQHGVPLKLYVDKFRDQKFEPAGFTGNEDIRIAKSLPDYVFRWLEKHYDSSAKESGEKANVIPIRALPDKRIEVVDLSAAHGPPCEGCGNLTRRSGSCYVCTNCGETTGCS